MRDHLKTVAVYLTGGVIAQTLYSRVIRHYRESRWEKEQAHIATRVAEEQDRRDVDRMRAARSLHTTPREGLEIP